MAVENHGGLTISVGSDGVGCLRCVASDTSCGGKFFNLIVVPRVSSRGSCIGSFGGRSRVLFYPLHLSFCSSFYDNLRDPLGEFE